MNKTVKVTFEFDYPSNEKMLNAYIWKEIEKIILNNKCISWKMEEVTT